MTAKGLLFLLFLSLSACSTLSQKQSAAESAAVYSTEKAIEAGRFDLAKSYNQQATRLVPAPAKEPKVSPIISQGKRYVVLPPESNGLPALALGSPAADTLISQDKALQGQLNAENQALAATEKATDKVIAEKQAIVDEAETAKVIANHSFWGRVRFYGFIALAVAALGALCFFFPAVVPVLLAFWRAIVALATTVFNALASFIGGLLSKWKK